MTSGDAPDGKAAKKFARMLLRACHDARMADPTAEVAAQMLGVNGWTNLVIRPATSEFTRWLTAQGLAGDGPNGTVVMPFNGSRAQAAALARTLTGRMPGVTNVRVTDGTPPWPSSYHARLAQLQDANGTQHQTGDPINNHG
ncbi:hypothetical protein [Actinomadura sp. WAC 06369]|uniref:hypothetical protein n=1 Tax=Actinomadura sp. WAC 06369 TaxID=2203193 RepID=UPI000F7B0E71|nr:hypothetical protein [Actinomadura sp. WAC 06369]